MKIKPLITIYLTNYNYGKYLTRSITSAKNQIYKNIEIIVIDDCSSDNSKKIINKLKKKISFKVIFNKRRKGLVKSANIAIKISKGKYVLRLDADDYLHKNAIQELYAAINKEPGAALVFPNFITINSQSKKLKKFNYKERKSFSILDFPAHGACSLIKKNFLFKNGYYNEAFDRQDGFYLWLLVNLKQVKILHCKKYLFYYRKHSKNLTKNKLKILNVRLKILNYFMKKSSKFRKDILLLKHKTLKELNALKR